MAACCWPLTGRNISPRKSSIATTTYRYAEAVLLRDAEGAMEVNRCELTTTAADGKVPCRNAFATGLALDGGNVAEVVEAGRSRRKVENENNNTLRPRATTSRTTTATASSTCRPCLRA
jgi:hypothetical protein